MIAMCGCLAQGEGSWLGVRLKGAFDLAAAREIVEHRCEQ